MSLMDGEMAIAMAAGNAMRKQTSQAQSLVDRKNSEIHMLTLALQAARRELSLERGKRIAAELRIEELLDMPI